MIRCNRIGDDDWLNLQMGRYSEDLKQDRKMAIKKRNEPFTELDTYTVAYVRTDFGQALGDHTWVK